MRSDETYGEWLRRMWRLDPHGDFTRDERAMLREEDAWSAANPIEVARLDAYVGRRFVLARDVITFAEDIRTREDRRGVPRGYGRGTRYDIVLRIRDRLLGRDLDRCAMLLRREWLAPVQLRTPRRLAI